MDAPQENPPQRHPSSSPQYASGFPPGTAAPHNAGESRSPQCQDHARPAKWLDCRDWNTVCRSASQKRPVRPRRRARIRTANRRPHARPHPNGTGLVGAHVDHIDFEIRVQRIVIDHGERNILTAFAGTFETAETHVVFHVLLARNERAEFAFRIVGGKQQHFGGIFDRCRSPDCVRRTTGRCQPRIVRPVRGTPPHRRRWECRRGASSPRMDATRRRASHRTPIARPV